MESNINYLNNNIKNFEKKDIITTYKYDIKSKTNKLYYNRNYSSNNNGYLWKTYHNINEISKNKKYINSNNNNSIIEYNKIKQKLKLKRAIHSASLIKNHKHDSQNSSKKIILSKYNFNIRQVKEIISLIKKKLDLLRNFNEKENENGKYFLDINNNFKRNLNSSITSIVKRNKKYKNTLHKSRTIYKYNSQPFIVAYNENNNLKKIEKKNKNDLTPYPYKRLQKKLRKYFSFSKSIRLPEDQFISSHSSKAKILKNDIMEKYNYNYYNKSIIYKNKNKIEFKNCNKYKYIEITKKKDKSINTENTFVGKNDNNLDNNKSENKNGNERKDSYLFNEKIISSITNNKEIKFFITNSNNKKQKNSEREKKSIVVYHKNY